jgi:2'-5' RNA ligase
VRGFRGLQPKGTRATHPLDLHLTLRFLGPLSPEAISRVEAAAESVAGLPPAPLCIDRLGHFGRAGVLWAGPSVPSAALLELVARLEESLGAAGLPAETRPFRAHITLARKVRRSPPLAWGVPVPWLGRELVLAAGYQGQVPRYRVRRSVLLTGPLGGRLGCPPVEGTARSGPGAASSEV